MKKYLLLPFVFLIFISIFNFVSKPNSNVLASEDISVIDGDTIQVNEADSSFKVRLACIDAPEMSQPLGMDAYKVLNNAINNAEVLGLNIIGTDRFDRQLGILHIDNKTAQQILIESSTTYVFHQFKANCPIYDQLNELETKVKNQRLGIWGLPAQTPPWIYRQQKRN